LLVGEMYKINQLQATSKNAMK